ncbi:MAG TPA: HAD-IA family hydrolase [Bryobacteraceae bacterium]|jgi:phosphoglycolate phosphatase|nr:HAD-IA family hydrolase [Bryobacteraceae bacterium]
MPLVIFDLDGTLIDSRLDLAHAVNNTRAQAGRGPLPHEQIFSFVGNGAPVLVKRAMGPEASEDEVARALEFFLEYYRHHALDYTVVYPQVGDALRQMHAAGAKLAVLTNKPVKISHRIMEGLGLSQLFFRIYGGNSFDHKKPHRIGIDTLREESGVAAADTWMVGDSWVDVQTARNAGVCSCGVSWGFQPETFREFPPDVVVDNLEDFAANFG